MRINNNSLSLSYIFIIITLFTLQTQAWLPGEQREIYSQDGSNLFNTTGFTNTTTPSNYTSTSKIARKRWLPASGTIRGVDLGSLFVLEPWMASTEWSDMGCSGQNSEFDCVSALGQDQANINFQNHWNTWITQDDIDQMQSYGLNTIRVPVGYWMKEDLVYQNSEFFPQGGMGYLERLCGWASDAGFYIIIDLHGAPGAQVAQNADTGQYAPSPGFYVDYQYSRAESFLYWLTTMIHNNTSFRNVGMIGILNEPVQNADTVATMRSDYYPNAYAAVRNAESALGITTWNSLHVQMMNEAWGSGDPTESLPDDAYFVAYDDHRYLKYDTSVPVTQATYINNSCTSDKGSDDGNPTVVGEFSLSVPDDVQFTADWDPSTQQAFYTQWFAAQITTYEKDTNGWIFWAWKAQLGDYRWSYVGAVAAGVIPSNFSQLQTNACASSAA